MPGMLRNVPVIDYRNKYVVRCLRCHGYLSSNCVIAPEQNSWICSLCGSKCMLPKDYDINSGVEIHSPVYDMIINNESFLSKKEEKKFKRMFAILIDTSNSKFCQLFSNSVKKALSQIQDESIVICLFSSGQGVTYYDPVRHKSYVVNDFDDLQLPPFQFLPFSDTKNFIFKSIDNIINISKTKNNSEIKTTTNFRNIIKIGQEFLKEYGGVFIISLFSMPVDINTTQNDNNPYNIPKDQSDIIDIGFSLNASSISVHIFHQYDDAIQNNHSIVTDTLAGITSGSTYVINSNHFPIIQKNGFDGYDTSEDFILDSQLRRILCTTYLWKSLCILRTHPEIDRLSYLGNCVVRKNGVCTLGAFPSSPSTSVSYELVFPRNPSVLAQLETVGLQFAMMFVNDEGLQVNRVMSYNVKIGENAELICNQSHVDVCAVSSLVAKLAVKKMRDSDFFKCAEFIKQNEKFCLPNFFNCSSLFMNYNDRRMFKFDIDVADSVFVYGASVNEIVLYLAPRVLRRKSAVWKMTNLAVFVVPEKGRVDEVKNEILGEGENAEKSDFRAFYDECVAFIGWNLPVIFVCE